MIADVRADESEVANRLRVEPVDLKVSPSELAKRRGFKRAPDARYSNDCVDREIAGRSRSVFRCHDEVVRPASDVESGNGPGPP